MIPKVVLEHIKLEKEKRRWKCSPRLTSLCLGIFSTQSAENTLFVRRECLASVGSFVLLLIHCLDHIAVDDLQQDSNPTFLRSFYKVFIACTGVLLLLLCDSRPIPQDSKCYELCNISNLLKSHWRPLVPTAFPKQISCGSI